jgi:hypothetical protein
VQTAGYVETLEVTWTGERARFTLSRVPASISDHGRERASTSCKASALTN